MRIAFDHQIFSHQAYGGVSRYLCEIAREMAADPGHRVSVVAPLHVTRYLREAAPGLRVLGRSVPQWPRTARVYRAINDVLAPPLLRNLEPQIVHETYYDRRRFAPRGARVVVTVHDMIQERLTGHFRPDEPVIAEKRLAVQRADHVICVSENTRRDLLAFVDLDPARTSVVLHGYTPLPAAAAGAAAAGRPYLLYVGTRFPYKNFGRFLEAFAASPRLRGDFDVACFGGGSASADEAELMRSVGLVAERVRFEAGDDRRLAALYAGARLFVYPSLYEGFGIPLLEAMGAGCPVACSARSSFPEVVGDAAELFDPEDIGSIRDALERVAFDDGRREALARHGRARAAEFSWRRCAAETLEAYRKTLA